jgi:hypothetical protein
LIISTAKAHFDEDIARAYTLHNHASTLPAAVMSHDVLRAAWMMAVGACDAYFCDAYVDLLARTMRAKDEDRNTRLPAALETLEVPIGQFFTLVQMPDGNGECSPAASWSAKPFFQLQESRA